MENKVQLTDLLKAIDDYLDKDEQEEAKKSAAVEEEAKKAKEEEDKKKKDEEDAKKAKEEEDKKKKEEEDAKKGDAEGGGDNIGHKKDLPAGFPKKEGDSKKSFTDEEYEEYLVMKKAKLEEEAKMKQEKEEALLKSITALNDQMNGLKSQIDELSKAPVAAPKSVDGLSIVSKGSESETDLKKSEEGGNDLMKAFKELPAHIRKAKVANVLMEKGVREGKLNPEDVAEYEFSGNIRDNSKRTFAFGLVRKALDSGDLVI